MKKYTIVLADDHVIMRECIERLIDTQAGLAVVGQAGDGHELLDLLQRTTPDMVILDISMPGLLGTEAAREIHNRYPDIQVLMLTMHKDKEFLSMALKAGASGYLLKEDSGDELLRAITRIRRGETYLSQKLAKAISQENITRQPDPD
jgi:DNA-binding NarL/FixJ family response regulator